MKINPVEHPWITAPETLAVLAALGEARFVGGAVRNALLGLAVSDIDIAVPFPPTEAQKRLEAAGIKVVPTGFEHGTVTAIRNGKLFEVTSLRRDVETDGRRAVVAYTQDWEADAARRDFTINALYAAGDGEVFDYHGGLADLAAGRVRFVGDAGQRIAEDYLRILRLFRFHAWYGKGEIDADALRASAAARSQLKKLSGERIAKELLRLLECPGPLPVLRMMAASGILSELLPGPLHLARLDHLVQIDAEDFLAPDPLLRLAALLPDREAAKAVGERLKLSNAARDRIEDLAGVSLAPQLSAKEVRKSLYRLGAPRFKDRVLLAWADTPLGASALAWRMLLKMADGWQRPHFPLSGGDVIAAGVPEGPQVGTILTALESWWMDEDFPDDQEALLAKLKSLVQGQ